MTSRTRTVGFSRSSQTTAGSPKKTSASAPFAAFSYGYCRYEPEDWKGAVIDAVIALVLRSKDDVLCAEAQSLQIDTARDTRRFARAGKLLASSEEIHLLAPSQTKRRRVRSTETLSPCSQRGVAEYDQEASLSSDAKVDSLFFHTDLIDEDDSFNETRLTSAELEHVKNVTTCKRPRQRAAAHKLRSSPKSKGAPGKKKHRSRPEEARQAGKTLVPRDDEGSTSPCTRDGKQISKKPHGARPTRKQDDARHRPDEANRTGKVGTLSKDQGRASPISTQPADKQGKALARISSKMSSKPPEASRADGVKSTFTRERGKHTSTIQPGSHGHRSKLMSKSVVAVVGTRRIVKVPNSSADGSSQLDSKVRTRILQKPGTPTSAAPSCAMSRIPVAFTTSQTSKAPRKPNTAVLSLLKASEPELATSSSKADSHRSSLRPRTPNTAPERLMETMDAQASTAASIDTNASVRPPSNKVKVKLRRDRPPSTASTTTTAQSRAARGLADSLSGLAPSTTTGASIERFPCHATTSTPEDRDAKASTETFAEPSNKTHFQFLPISMTEIHHNDVKGQEPESSSEMPPLSASMLSAESDQEQKRSRLNSSRRTVSPAAQVRESGVEKSPLCSATRPASLKLVEAPRSVPRKRKRLGDRSPKEDADASKCESLRISKIAHDRRDDGPTPDQHRPSIRTPPSALSIEYPSLPRSWRRWWSERREKPQSRLPVSNSSVESSGSSSTSSSVGDQPLLKRRRAHPGHQREKNEHRDCRTFPVSPDSPGAKKSEPDILEDVAPETSQRTTGIKITLKGRRTGRLKVKNHTAPSGTYESRRQVGRESITSRLPAEKSVKEEIPKHAVDPRCRSVSQKPAQVQTPATGSPALSRDEVDSIWEHILGARRKTDAKAAAAAHPDPGDCITAPLSSRRCEDSQVSTSKYDTWSYL